MATTPLFGREVGKVAAKLGHTSRAKPNKDLMNRMESTMITHIGRRSCMAAGGWVRPEIGLGEGFLNKQSQFLRVLGHRIWGYWPSPGAGLAGFWLVRGLLNKQ